MGDKCERIRDAADELYEEGLKYRNAGYSGKAVSTWKKILEMDFRNLRAVNAIAGVYAESGKLDKAKKYISLAMKVGGGRTDLTRANLAGILFESGEFPEAGEILRSIDTRDPQMINNLTRVLYAQGKVEKTLEMIEEFLSTDSASAAAAADGERSLQEIFLRGVDCILRRRPASAARFLETHGRVLPPGPLSSGYFNAGIHFLQEEDDPVSALKFLSEGVKRNPEDPELREALDEAALKVIADLEGRRKFSAAEKAAMALAYRTVGRSVNPAETGTPRPDP